ncbi:hypothetical protein FRB90_006913, partial [Tulasnella sp. 427]
KDAPLIGNAGFWVDDGELEDYTRGKGAWVQEQEKASRLTCHSFKAGDPSRWAQKSGKAVSGVAMVSCARHSFIQPNGTVDLDKGERFAYVDVAFASVIRQQHPEQRHLHTYDIGCKYSVHFKERVTQSVLTTNATIEENDEAPDTLISSSQFPSDFEIKVPSWHVLGHNLRCILANNLRYTPLVGRTAGEGVETIWSIMNAHQYSTREMTHGHRRDCLTDIFNDYNWLKLCSESHRVSGAYFLACQTFLSKSDDLQEIEEDIGEERLRTLVEDAARRGTEQFGAQMAEGPSKSKVLLSLRAAEENAPLTLENWENSHSSQPAPSEALFLGNALELEDLQYQLRTRNVDEYIAEGTGGADKRRVQHLRSLDALRRRLEEHLSALRSLCPSIPPPSFVRSQDPTLQDLYLPSDFSQHERRNYGLNELGKKEGELRIGNAHDHLNSLKDALGLRRMLIEAKKAHVRGYKCTTRSETSIKRAGDVVARHKHGYRRNWNAMGKLGIQSSPNFSAAGLQELRDSDVQSLREFIDKNQYLGNAGELPWIWRSVGGALTASAPMNEVKRAIADWEHEVLRLTWIHARSARDRWWEEQALLFEELRQIVATFERMETIWKQKQPSNVRLPSVLEGFRACSLKKAEIFRSLATEARVQFSVAREYQERQTAAASQALAQSMQLTGIGQVEVAAPIDMEEIL